MARARSARNASKSFYSRNKREEEEEEKIEQTEEPESEPAAEPPQPIETPAQEETETAQAAPKPVKSYPTGGARGIPKLNNQQRFEVGQNVADQKTSTKLVEAGELDLLPEKLQNRKEELEEQNAAGRLGHAQTKQWSSTGNTISVDPASIKDVKQLAYFGTTLTDDGQRETLYKAWAKQEDMSLDDLYYQAETMLGDRAFDQPKSNKGKLKQAGMYAIDGSALDVDTMTAAQAVQAMHMMPDKHPYRKNAELSVRKLYGLPKDFDLSFVESGDLTNTEYNNAVSGFRNKFTISDGEVEENVRAYLDMVDDINADYENPRVRKQMLDTLSYVYGNITGVKPPPLDELEAMNAQYDAEAADTEQSLREDGKEPGFFGKLWQKAGGAVVELFKAGAKFFKIGDEEETEEEPAGITPSSGGSAGGSSGASGAAQGPAYQPTNAEDAAEVTAMQGAVETAEVQGPDYQPQSTPATEEPQATVSNAEKYANRIAYDPNMTDAQVFAQWRKGATLDERNMAQIKWVTDNRNVQALFNGMGMYGDLGTNETGKRNVINKYNYFGNSIGTASMVVSNGTLPQDAADTAMLALGDVVNEIDRIVSDPNSGIIVPKGQNMYEYVLSLPEYSKLAAQVEAVSNTQIQANEAYAEQAINEEKARQAQLESDRKAMLAGNGTPEMAARLAAEYSNEYVDLGDDEMRAVYRFQLSERSGFFSDGGTFWNGSTAAAAEGNNLRRAGRGYGEFKVSLKNETQALIDEYTTAAIKMGMSLEDYLGNAGITDLSQVIDIAYSGMLERGNSYANDAQAQEAAAEISTSSVGKWDAFVMGGRHGMESYAADFSQTLYMMIDAADYNTTVLDLQNDYRSKYGDEMAASMYYADLMAYIDSGALSEESAKDLLDHMARANSIFDVAFEIDPGFFEGLARTTHEELQKDVESLEAVAQTLPENERWIFNGASGIAYSIPGMAVSTVTGGVSGSALLGSAVGWGVTEYSSAYDANRAKGMSPGMAGFMALGNAGVSAAVNMGGTGTQMDLVFGGSAYQTFRKAIMGKDGKGLLKAIGKEVLSKGHEEGVEEVTETVLGGMFDLLDKEALAIDSGAAPSLSRTVRGIVETIEEADVAAIGKELLTNYGMGVAYGGIFSLAGVARTAVAAKRGVNAQNHYASIDLATQMADGTVPFTEENVGKVYAAVQKDLEDPRYRRWIDSASMAAKDQNATVTAMMMGAGGEQRKTAVVEAQKAQEYEAKAEAARSASQTAQSRWWELRERLAGGDLSVEVELESARMQWQKAETALQEAENAAQKSKERATQSMSEWLKACRTMGTTAKSWELKRRADQVANARMEAALRLSDIYNNQAQNEAEAEREVAYAEDYVFQEEDLDESGVEQGDIDAMSDEELDAEISSIAQAEADEQAQIAEIESRREELGLTDEAVQEMTGEVSAATDTRKKRIIAREKSRFNDAFERMQQAIEMENDEAAEQIQMEYDAIGNRLRTLGVDTDALIAEQYGIPMEDADAAYAAAQEQEAQREEDEKYEKLTDDLSRRIQATNDGFDSVAAARRYFAGHEIYVNESQVADILAADGVKNISQFNIKHHTRLTTKRESGAMPLDGHVLSDIASESAGSVQTDADPVSELLRVVQAGKKYVAERQAQRAEAKELAEKRKAAEKQRRSKVDALAKPIQTEADAAAANSAANSAIEVTLSHTAKQQRDILAFQKAVDNDVLKAAQAFRQDPNSGNIRVPISKVGSREAADIKGLVGVDVTGYEHTADRNFFRHVENRHGANGEADQSMRELSDVARVGWVIGNYDSVELVRDGQGDVKRATGYIDKNKEHMPLIRYEKRLDGSVYVVEAVGESKWKKLWLVSAYIQKNGPANQSQNQAVTQTPHATSGLGHNVQNANASPANNSVAQGNGTVNNNSNIDAAVSGDTAQTPAQKQAQRSKKLEGSALKAVQSLAKEMKVGLRVKSRQRFNSADARMGSNVLGYYKNGQRNAIVRSADAGRVSVTGHEIGHAVQEQLGISSNQQMIDSWKNTFGAVDAYTPQQYNHEAFAEFFWRYLTGRDAAVAYAGDAYVDAFEQALRQKKLNKAVSKAQTQVSSYWNSEAEAKIRSRIVNAYEANTPEDTSFARRVEIRYVDDTAAAEDFQDVIRARKGEKHLSLEDNLRDTIRFNRRAAARANECLTKNMVDQDGNVIGESLKAALSDVKGKDFDLFWEYELAKHSLDRDFAKGATNQVFDEDTLSTTDRRAFIAQVEADHPEFKTANDRFQKWRRQFMDAYLVSNGFLGDPAQANLMMDALEAAYPNYVPTYRPKNKNDRRATVGGNTYQMRTATGSTEDVVNPFDSFVSMVNSIVQMTADNDSRKKFAELYDRYGAPLPGETGPGVGLFANEITQDMQRVSVSTENMRERITKMLDALGTDQDVIVQIGDIIGDEKVEYHGTGRVNLNNVITVRNEDGSKRYFEVYNPELYELLANTNAANRPGILDGVAKVTRMMSMLTTGSNPVFGLTNAMRDFQNSVNYGSWASNYATGAVKWLGALWDVVTKGEASQEYDALGGGGWTAFDTKTRKGAEEIRGEIFKGYNTSNIGRIGKMAGRTIWKIATMEAVNEAIEKTSRLAEYKYGKHDLTTAEGRIEAFLAAQDATTDFARRGNGQVARDLKNLIPFFNASTQGIYRNARQFTAQESDRAGIRFAKNVVNSALASALANSMLLSWMDDDEKEEFFYLSDDLKAKHMFLPNFAPDVFGDAALIRIPLDQNPVSYAVNAAVANFFWDGESDNEFVVEISAVANAIKDNLNPVGSTILDPAIAMLSNKNWYGSDIVPSYLEGYDETNQYTEETPTPFVEISKRLSGVGIKVSPMMLQYMAEQYTGYIGQTLIPALPSEKNQDGIASGLLNSLVATARKRVTSDPLKSNDVVSTVYDSYDAMNAVYKAGKSKRNFEIDYFRSDLTDRERGRAINEADNLIHSGGVIYEAKKDISAGYARIDQINDRDDLTDEEKHTLIQKIHRDMVETALDVQEVINDYNTRYKDNGIVKQFMTWLFN